MGFTRTKRKKPGMCGLLRGEALPWLGNDLWDGCRITKSHEHLPASACTESWHSDEGRQGEQTRVCCQFIHQMWFTPVDFSAYVCVCVRLPFYALQAPKLLTASSWIWCKNVCSKVRQCRWVCVLYFTCFISERAAPDDNAKSTSLFPCACVRWKVCHASNIVSDIWRCLLTVGALSSSHFNICLLTQTTKKVTHVTSDHIVTQKLFFLYSTNLKMSSQVHLNHDLQNLVLLGNKKPNY